MTTRELDEIGRTLLEREGAVSSPQSAYDFPGATCISVNEEIAHGIPGDRVIAPGDLVNIDASASKNGYFADTGATYRVGPVRPSLDHLCRDGRRAMQIGIAQVGSNRPLAGIGGSNWTLLRNVEGTQSPLPGAGRPISIITGRLDTTQPSTQRAVLLRI